MNPTLNPHCRTALLTLALLLACAPALAAGQIVPTHTTLLIGFPPDQAPEVGRVVVVPGTVIPITGAGAVDLAGFEQGDLRAKRLAKTAENLTSTFHLSEMEVNFTEVLQTSVGQPAAVTTSRAAATLEITLELLSFDERTATYQVRFTHDGKAITDTPVAAVRGRQTVVGGLDGAEAPYLFLVIEPSPTADFPLRAEGDITHPRVIQKVMPKYTEEARKEKLQGLVVVQAVIEKDGTVSNIEVLQGLDLGLDEAAVEAIRQWRFEPARNAAGKPVAVFYNLTVNFRLE